MSDPLNDTTLQRIAGRLLRDAADRDDAIQDMWLASLEAGSPTDHGTAGWKVNTLRHRAMRLWDHKRRRSAAEAEASSPRPLPDPVEELDRESIRELLQRTLQRLPASQAQVIRARFFEDVSLEEIARREGSPAGTIRARLSRGLAEMRRRLDERTGDPRLTALALIRNFDLKPNRALLPAGVAAPSLLVGLALAASLALVAAIGWILLGGDEEPGQRELVSRATEPDAPIVPAVAPPRLVGERESVPSVADAADEAATSSVSPAASPDTNGAPEPDPRVPVDAMRVTIRARDAAGDPQPGFSAKAWLPADRQLPFVGPAGDEGALSFLVTEANLWEYFQAAIEGTNLETILEEGTFVKFSVQAPGAVRHPDLHVPFVPGSERELEVRFDLQPGEWLGRVVDRRGAPIPKVRVESLRVREWEEGGLTRRLTSDVRSSGEDGRFLFADLAPGQAEFRLVKEGYVSAFVDLVASPGKRVERELVLDRAVPVVGMVLDAAGNGVPNARVFPDAIRNRPGEWTRTDAEGYFLLSTLPPGDHKLWAYGPVGTPLENQVASETLRLVRHEVIWEPVLASSSELTVEVVDAEGAPVPEQLVLFMTEDAMSAQGWWEIVVTGADGRATVGKVPDQAIRAELRGGRGDGQHSMGAAPFAMLGGLWARSQPHRLQLGIDDRNLGRVRGSIVLADGSPCDDANVSIKSLLSLFPALCDQTEGRFVIEHLPAGEILLIVERPFGGYWSTRFHVAPGQNVDLGVLQLPEPGTLRVTNGWPLVDADDRPVYGILAAILPGLGGPLALLHEQTQTPLDGEFELLPGNYQIFARVAGLVADMRDVTVRSGEVTAVELIPPFDPLEEDMVVEEVEKPDDGD